MGRLQARLPLRCVDAVEPQCTADDLPAIHARVPIGASIGTLAGSALCRALSDKFPWGLVVNPYGLAAAWGIALLLALGFGMYPAIRAARLSPMEAMR